MNLLYQTSTVFNPSVRLTSGGRPASAEFVRANVARRLAEAEAEHLSKTRELEAVCAEAERAEVEHYAQRSFSGPISTLVSEITTLEGRIEHLRRAQSGLSDQP